MPYRPVSFRPDRVEAEEVSRRIQSLYEVMDARRSVRMFSPDPVPREVIENAIRIAGTAPSGAHKQPWHFVATDDPDTKRRIRTAAEAEEREFYHNRAPKEWLDALEPLGTDFVKEYLETAPWLIVVFRRDYEVRKDGARFKCYYMTESVGIAVGFLVSALHQAGLCTLTHTPAPMTFLRQMCGRPANEKPFVLLPVGYPADDCVVPDLKRKGLDDIATFMP